MNTNARKIALPWPFLPMRPEHGETLTPDNAVAIVRHTEAAGYLAQPKLGGDRVLLRVTAGGVEVFNRYGTPYGFNCRADDWRGAPCGTILDAEAYGGHAYAFECVALGKTSLAGQCVSVRAAVACDLTATLGRLPWLWGRPSNQWLQRCADNLPRWEGVVLKRLGTPYVPLTKPHLTSWAWLKLKWTA